MGAEWLCIGWKQCMRTFRWCFISLFRQKGYNTWCSQAVSHPSTNQALRCYVVYLRWSDENRCIQRRMVVATDIWNNNALVLENSFIQHCFTHLAIFFHFFRCILMMIFLRLSWFAFRALGSRPLSQSTFKKKLLSISYKLIDNNFFVL